MVAPIGGVVNPDVKQRFLGTIAQPLAERGYYVFPPRMTQEVMKQAGLEAGLAWKPFSKALDEDPEEYQAMKREAAEIAALFGADAVLFVTGGH